MVLSSTVWEQTWESSGLAVVGFQLQDNADGTQTMYSVCATLHLTDFSGVTDPEVPQFNTIDPVGDAGLLTHLLDPGNLFPTLSVLGLTAVLTLIACISGIVDR